VVRLAGLEPAAHGLGRDLAEVLNVLSAGVTTTSIVPNLGCCVVFEVISLSGKQSDKQSHNAISYLPSGGKTVQFFRRLE